MWRAKEAQSASREVLGNHRRQSQRVRLELGAVSQRLIPSGRIVFIADAHRGDGKRFVMRADEKLTAFLELETAIRPTSAELSLLRNPS